MKQQFNQFYTPLLALLFLLSVSQMVFGADNEVGESDTLTECYPHQTTFSQPPIPEDYPICDGAIEPTERATFDVDTGKVILPAVRVNQKGGYVYSLELSLLSAADDPILRFEMTHYCLLQEPSSLPRHAEIATLTLPPGKIRIPAIEIEGITYSASLEVEHPSRQVWEESEIFTRKKERVRFKVPRREVRQEAEKPKYPVLFVHGLKSSGQTWESYYTGWWQDRKLTYGGNIYIRDKYHLFEAGEEANQNNLLTRRTRSDPLSFFEIKVKKNKKLVEAPNNDFYTMNFSSNNNISFAAQGLELKAIVNKISEWTGKEGVYVVGHSMGGLATRAYLQYFNDDKVKGLITVGTPHKGSRKDWFGKLGSAFVSGDIVEQLKPNSIDLNMLNDDCPQLSEECPLPGNVNYFFVVVRGDRGFLFGFGGEYPDNKGDGIVPIDSQWLEDIGNKTEPEISISGKIEVHTSEPGNADIEKLVWNKLMTWSKAEN